MHNVCILLATYNGAQWLPEQLESIARQQGVKTHVVVSDDQSKDATRDILAKWSTRLSLTILPPSSNRFGSAHRNFLRLMRDADIGKADYVALCDQDDIWLPDKLQHAIQRLQTTGADGYSSDVLAFWPDGRQRLLRKSHPLRQYDHLFGSPGPGCTFVLPVAVYRRLRTWVTSNFEDIQDIWVHDWLMYAYVRSQALQWYIDTQPLMLYRQHGHNEIGANHGWRAARARWRQVRSGAYRREILAIARAVGERSRVVQAVERLSWTDRLWLIAHAREMRRQLSEALILAGLILFMPRSPSR